MLKLDLNLLWTVVDVLILYVLLRKFLFKPIQNVLDQRQKTIEADIAAAQTSKTEAAAALTTAQDKLRNVDNEAAARREARQAREGAAAARQVAGQQQVDHRHGQPLADGLDALARHAADQRDAVPRGMGGEPRGGTGGEAHIGIEEQQMGAARRLGQPRAGVHLARPAGRQGGRGDEPQPRIARGEGADDVRRAVGRAVIHHHHLDRHALLGQRGLDAGADIRRLVARGDEDGDERALRRPALRRAQEEQVDEAGRGGKYREHQRDPGGVEGHGARSGLVSWRGSNRCPRSSAPIRRQV